MTLDRESSVAIEAVYAELQQVDYNTQEPSSDQSVQHVQHPCVRHTSELIQYTQ